MEREIERERPLLNESWKYIHKREIWINVNNNSSADRKPGDLKMASCKG